jgi:hypothetical protein
MHCRMLIKEGAVNVFFRGQKARKCKSRRYKEYQRFSEQEQTPHKPVHQPFLKRKEGISRFENIRETLDSKEGATRETVHQHTT